MKEFKTNWAGQELIIETGKLAGQADGAVTVRYGDTLILATAVIGKQPSYANYLPLMVDYEEKLYAAGKIKGSRWVKREGRPSDEAILTGRLIDRCIRPLFDKRIRRDIQVVVTVFSLDEKNDPDILSILGASLALGISSIPFQGPIAACRIVKNGDQNIINADYQERENANLDLVVAGDGEKINMLEAEAKEALEPEIVKLIESGQKNIKELIDFQKKIIKEIGAKKEEMVFIELDAEIKKEIDRKITGKTPEEIEEIKAEYIEDLELQYFEKRLDEITHKNAIENDKRPDNRKFDEVRPLLAEVGLFPRTHGSGLFSRGKTQVASTVTLGSPGAEQFLETMETEGRKRFMHHYNFPPFSVGEVRPMRGPGRRDIGHGALVEKTLKAIIPPQDEFPYTIRVVSETLSSNGSSSMASVCASSLALMHAGVPIKKHMAGIAMGLMTNGKTNKILTDIQGPEDHHGDMDLKVAGTERGITALQMDVKISGIDLQILQKALEQAKQARIKILEILKSTISEPSKTLSPYAPKIKIIQIDKEKIGKVIGPGGKTIRKITEETDTEIDIEEDGSVNVTGQSAEMIDKTIKIIEDLTKEAKLGENYQGKIVKITDFGAFVEIFPGQDGLLHSSEMRTPLNKIGETIAVTVKNIDNKGRINLSLT